MDSETETCPCRSFAVLGWGQWIGHEFMPCDHGTHYPDKENN